MLSFGTVPVEAEASFAGAMGEDVWVEFLLTYLMSFATAAHCLSSYGPSDLLAVSLADSLPDSVSRSLHLSWSSTQKSKASVRRFRASSHAAGVA